MKTPKIKIELIHSLYNGKCFYCGESIDIDHSTKDHFIPLSKKGSNNKINIVLACAWCNRKKGNLLPRNFYKKMGWEIPEKVIIKLGDYNNLLKDSKRIEKKIKPRNEFGETEGMIRQREKAKRWKERLANLNKDTMNNESIIELQKLDCNCNNCKSMIRNIKKFNESVNIHYIWQLDYFNAIRGKLIKKARLYHRNLGDLIRFDLVATQADKMKFQFDKSECILNYGYCEKFNKDISFIPNTCQLNTQECFEHRNEK